MDTGASKSATDGSSKNVNNSRADRREREDRVLVDHSEEEPLLGGDNEDSDVSCEIAPFAPALTTNAESMMHLMKGNIGTGILAMASAVHNAGLWTGLVGIFILGVIAIHCMHLLVNASHQLKPRVRERLIASGQLAADGSEHFALSYGDVAEEACTQCSSPAIQRCGIIARALVNIFLCLTQFGFCIVYIMFVAENVKQVVDYYTDHSWDKSKEVYMCFVVLLILPYVYVRKLKHLAWFSTAANVLTALGLVIILQYCFRNLQPWQDLPAFNSWASLPLFFGTTIYAFEGIGVVLPIENKMRHPEDFVGLTGVLNTGMVIVAVLYAAVGFYGYLTFGDAVQGSITLDLPSTHWVYNAVKIVLSVAIFLTYGLQFYVPMEILLPFVTRCLPQVPENWIDITMRAVGVLITFFLAVMIPHLDLMISLVGALASSTLAIIFPPILDSLVFWPHMGSWRPLLMIKNIALLVIGLLGFVTGTAVSIMEIFKAF